MSQGIRWAFNVKEWRPSKAQWKLCLQCVQKEEVERCNRFLFIDDCKSSLVGQLLMRKAVSESLSLKYDKIIFSRTSSAKPYLLEGNENIFFNVSHHGDFCVLASELHMPVGVDVMKVEYKRTKPLSSYFESMKKQFSSYEWDFISLPGSEREQLERFYRLWCLKESYVKAIGTGIIFDLSTISFSSKTQALKESEVTTDTKLYKDGIYLKDWKFEESFLDANHCVAVALECIKETESLVGEINQCTKQFEVINFEELTRHCIPFESIDEDFWEIFTSKKEK